MKTFLIRSLVTLVVVSGLLTAVMVVRMARVQAPPVPRGEAQPFAFDEGGALERLAGAIRIPTISHDEPEDRDPSAWVELHRYLEEAFPRIHEQLRVETVSELSLLYTWEGSDPDAAPVLLAAHSDVVPAPRETLEAWTHPPFAGAVADGHVWGRGALDMKGPMMGILEAVEGLLARGFRPVRTVILAIGHDEEVGGEEGARQIAALLAERGRAPAWVLDEGGAVTTETIPGVRDPVALVGTAEKGYMTVAIEAESEGGHSSAPPAATAVGTVARAVARLEENPFRARIRGPTRELLETLAPHMDPATRMLSTNLWLLEPVVAWALGARPLTGALVRTTMAPTVFRAGEKENVLPTRARAVVNLRIAPWDTPDGVLERIRELTGDLEVEITVLADWSPAGDPGISSTDGEGYRAIRETAHGVFPDLLAVAPYVTIVATDGRHYQEVAGDVYRFAPFRVDPEVMERIHGVDERIPVGEYLQMVRFYAELIRRGAG